MASRAGIPGVALRIHEKVPHRVVSVPDVYMYILRDTILTVDHHHQKKFFNKFLKAETKQRLTPKIFVASTHIDKNTIVECVLWMCVCAACLIHFSLSLVLSVRLVRLLWTLEWCGGAPLPSPSLLPFLEPPTLSRSLPISPSLILSPYFFLYCLRPSPPPCHTRLLRNVNSCPN